MSDYINDWNSNNNVTKQTENKQQINESKFYAETTCISNIKNISNDTKDVRQENTNGHNFFF